MVLLGCSARSGMIVAVAAALGAAATAWLVRPRITRIGWQDITTGWRNIAIATLICTAAASVSVALRVHALTTGPVSELADKNAFITAEIALTDDPERRPNRGGHFNPESYVARAALKVVQYGTSRQTIDVPVTVFAIGRAWAGLLPSQHLEVTGRLARPTAGTSVAAILLVRGPPKVLTPPSALQTMAGSLRAGLRSAADVLPPDQRGLLPGLVVGDVSRMDPQVTSDMREAGLSHLNAVSGANLAIVAGATLALSRVIGLPLPVRAGVAAVAMLLFAVVARPSPSVLRALLMGLAAAIAMGTGRSKDGVAALSATVLFLILFVPELARSYGFALSVTATAGILLLAPRWRDKLSRSKENATPQDPSITSPQRAPLPATSAGRPPTDGHLHTGTRYNQILDGNNGPLLDDAQAHGRVDGRADGPTDGLTDGPADGRAHDWTDRRREEGSSRHRGLLRLPPLPRWVAEAVAVPAAAQVAVTPVLVLMAGQVTPVAVIANLLVAPAVAPATLLGFGAALVAPVWPDGARLLVIPAGYAVGWIITVARWAVNLPFATVPWPAGLPGLALLVLAVLVAIPILRRRAWRAVAVTVVAAALAAVLVIRPIAGPWPPKGWLMVMCDVGQGDGLIVAAGPGRAVVVDTGPDPAIMDKCLRRVGVDDVPLLVLTHAHADHVGGISGVLRNRRVGAVVVSPHRDGSEGGGRISTMLAGRRIPEWTASPGTRWRFGPSELTVVAPALDSGGSYGYGEGSEINNASVVLHVRWRSGSALLGGDLETEAQDDLLHRFPIRADILKTPHHGSNRQSPEFLGSLGARAALISVGAGNDYGHPAPSTLGLLRRLGLTVHRTDQSGDLAVVEGEDGMAVIPRGRDFSLRTVGDGHGGATDTGRTLAITHMRRPSAHKHNVGTQDRPRCHRT
ncbi:ComEC/Rec2 family competence protein [Nonomuraea aridisoli]|uniref:ComEC/Rec2 family competence protein n=1 Tax=Nonomuraea aridisoli TaxID=2070368 RepID=UPI001F46C644|nr:ComEC/Rec2 family competence protein [Nonomuraea aridisoli]